MSTPDRHRPHRGSDIETWLKQWREDFEESSITYRWLDAMLDDYRLRADYGKGLLDGIEDLQ